MTDRPMPDFEYASTWDFKEHARAVRALSSQNLRRQPWRRVLWAVWPVLFLAILFGLPLLRTHGPVDWPRVLVAAAPWIAVLIFWYWFITVGAPYLAASRTRKNDPASQGIIVRSLNPDGFQVSGAGINLTLSWEAVPEIVETPEFFLVYSTRLNAYPIPKRLMTSPEEVQRVRDYLRGKVQERARLLS